MDICLHENGLHLDIQVNGAGEVFLLNLSPHRLARPEKAKWYRMVELQLSGLNQDDHHGPKHTGTQPGSLLRYKAHSLQRTVAGRLLRLTQQWQGLEVTSCLQFYDGIPVVRSWTELYNGGDEALPLEYLSSFALTGLSRASGAPRDKQALVHIPHSTWKGEAQWKAYTPNQLGYNVVETFTMKRVALASTGSWAAEEYLPMGSYQKLDTGVTLTWQIETSGSWNWEIADIDEQLFLHLAGPSCTENGWTKWLAPGGRFTSVACALAAVEGDFTHSIQALTRYRRAIRRPNTDNALPSIIFNDYMNCLFGDPTTEKELPLIDAAAELGCKYYCIDAGWYDDGPWWDGVGEWLPAPKRFPGGIGEVLGAIRAKGMIPGLWLEIEVMGISCPLVQKVPADWFFQRNGRPVIDHSRYQLDFRNPEVVAHADRVIDRLVRDYGVGYIKMDYNINAGVGTGHKADSAADGLLEHNRAYLSWVDGVFVRYPELVIENCGSGGMRMEYSLLARHSIQSVTDQEDYRKMAAIACNCMTAVPPEQAAIWSYPLADGDEEETIFNMVNALLMRVHQSGHLAELPAPRRALVKEGLELHRSICGWLKTALPVWPLGLASFSDACHCVGLQCEDGSLYLAVWNLHCDEAIRLPLAKLVSGTPQAECIYPAARPVPCHWDAAAGELTLSLRPGTARLFRLSPKG